MTAPGTDDLARRLQWFHQARFGMFVHWGLYSLPVEHSTSWTAPYHSHPKSFLDEEYERLAGQFKPKPFPVREWDLCLSARRRF